MPTGYSLHVGVDRTRPGRYRDGRFPPLMGCGRAAEAMQTLAAARAFEPTLMVDRQATLEAVSDWLGEAARRTVAGDTVLVTFAGHGALADPDSGTRRPDDDDEQDQALVLYDRLLVDDALYASVKDFKTGVLVVFVTEACFSGTILTIAAMSEMLSNVRSRRMRPRRMLFLPFWAGLSKRRKVDADALLLAACHDMARTPGARTASEMAPFTARLLEVWREQEGEFPEGYVELHRRLGGDAQLFDGLLHDLRILKKPPFTVYT